jgi:hypothetical protein
LAKCDHRVAQKSLDLITLAQARFTFANTPNLVELEKVCSVYKQVTGHAKRRQCNHKTTEKMNENAYASAKSKELQPTAQADTVAAHLQHICFCPTAQLILIIP